MSGKDVGGVIVTGAGAKAFVAGADISQLATQGALEARARALRGQRVFTRFEQSPKPVIAAVNGFALGGGSSSRRVPHPHRLGEREDGSARGEARIGPGYGGTQRLPRLIGKGRALQLILTGEMIDAAEALRIGLVNKVVPDAELIAARKR